MSGKFDPAYELTGIPSVPVKRNRNAMFGGFDGADAADKTFAYWTPPVATADSLVLRDKHLADARSMDLGRNDAFIASGANYHRDSIVGSTYRLVPSPRYQLLGMSEAWAKEFSQELKDRWEAWAESEDCWADAARRLTFTGLVRLAVITEVYRGEVLASAEWLRDKTRPTRTAILMLDPERLRSPYSVIETAGGPRIRGGVEIDRIGQPLNYFIHDETSPSQAAINGNLQHKKIAARKPWGRRQIIHIMEPDRPGQTRGMSRLVTALRETQLGRRYRDVVLQNALANATYAAVIESELPHEQIFALMGSGSTTDPLEAVEQYMTAWTGSVGEYVQSSKRLTMNGAKIPVLPPGTKLTMQNAGSPGGVGETFEASVLRYMAASLGITAEELTRDLSNTNYSSIRAGMLMTNRHMRAHKAMIADRFANQILALWFEEEFNAGRFETLKGAPSIYETAYHPSYYLHCAWYGAGSGQVDELKETQAALLRVRGGLSSREQEIARLHGQDWRDVIDQMKVEDDYIKTAGLMLNPTQDNQMNASTGAASEADVTDPNADVAIDDTEEV